MFYNYELMNSSELRVVWCYANRQKVVSDNVGIPKICSKIEKMIDHDGTRKKLLSLRSATLLIYGTARLYKEELEKLYQDCIQLNLQMVYRRSRDASLADDNNTGSEEHSRNSNKRDKSQSARSHLFNSKNSSEKSDTRTKDSTDYESSAMASFTSDQSQVSNRSFAIDKNCAAVQTNNSYINNIKKREKLKRKHTSDANLKGFLFVFDEFDSPCKIIRTKIDKNVKYL